jgi:hypothetical protein
MPQETLTVKTDTILPLPVLDQIPVGNYSLTVPIKDDSVQVGFKGRPDGFDKLQLSVSPNMIIISRKDGDIQVVSGVTGKTEHGISSIVQSEVFVEPEPSVELRKADGGKWSTDSTQIASRLGLVRFVAKVGEAAISKDKRSQLPQS